MIQRMTLYNIFYQLVALVVEPKEANSAEVAEVADAQLLLDYP
jgi:hypothetical protein|tara:strand:+ start:164 stop:292 length:129 start_codon:yes stop_codon:yes gene_type:complete